MKGVLSKDLPDHIHQKYIETIAKCMRLAGELIKDDTSVYIIINAMLHATSIVLCAAIDKDSSFEEKKRCAEEWGEYLSQNILEAFSANE